VVLSLKNIKSLFLINLLLFLAFSSFAEIQPTQKTINGWKVNFINSGIGNEIAIVIRVQTGSQHDAPRLAGMAHLFEHFIFLGSELYKDKDYFNIVSGLIGATESNAATSNPYTTVNIKQCNIFTLSA
jgi:predicted Zn-dependent peptidase